MNRRDFLIKAAVTGAAAYGVPLAVSSPASGATRTARKDKPNILIIMVDQLREPQWSPPQARLDALLPSIARLRKDAVCFGGHYCAATACSPSRASFLTGLYAHQHGILRNVDRDMPELDTAFKTWGSALRDCGYNTTWYGKWHLSNQRKNSSLDPYGFDDPECPPTHGETKPTKQGDGEGIFSDGPIADNFIDWLAQNADRGPWATTVSFNNPHDICNYMASQYNDNYISQHPGARPFDAVPPNYETVDQLAENNKARVIQRQYVQLLKQLNLTPGSSPDDSRQTWIAHNNAYFAFQQAVDTQIGRVLDALDTRPDVRDNTIIVFLADHGELGASHGLRGKAIGVYDEEIRVPLLVKDPTGRYTSHTNIIRPQMVSTVDLYGMLLTIASGGSQWRSLPQYSHLAGRLDLTSILKNPSASGRDSILHTVEPAFPQNQPNVLPTHIVGYRTQNAKLAAYSRWSPDKLQELSGDQEYELYDYGVQTGRQEMMSEAKAKPALFEAMKNELTGNLIPNQLRRTLSPNLQEISERALQNYLALRPPKAPARAPKA